MLKIDKNKDISYIVIYMVIDWYEKCHLYQKMVLYHQPVLVHNFNTLNEVNNYLCSIIFNIFH